MNECTCYKGVRCELCQAWLKIHRPISKKPKKLKDPYPDILEQIKETLKGIREKQRVKHINWYYKNKEKQLEYNKRWRWKYIQRYRESRRLITQ